MKLLEDLFLKEVEEICGKLHFSQWIRRHDAQTSTAPVLADTLLTPKDK